jgi:hypothetical protein
LEGGGNRRRVSRFLNGYRAGFGKAASTVLVSNPVKEAFSSSNETTGLWPVASEVSWLVCTGLGSEQSTHPTSSTFSLLRGRVASSGSGLGRQRRDAVLQSAWAARTRIGCAKWRRLGGPDPRFGLGSPVHFDWEWLVSAERKPSGGQWFLFAISLQSGWFVPTKEGAGRTGRAGREKATWPSLRARVDRRWERLCVVNRCRREQIAPDPNRCCPQGWC